MSSRPAPAGPSATRVTPPNLAYFSYHVFPSQRAHTIQVMSMCDAFEQLGVDTTLFACRNPAFASVRESDLAGIYGVEHRFAMKLFSPRGGIWSYRCVAFAQSLRACRHFALGFTRSVLPALACALRGVPCILEVHDYRLGKTDRAALALVKRSSSVRFVAISEVLAGLLVERWGVPRERISVAHDGFRPPSGAPTAPALPGYDLSRDRLRAVYVGSFYAGRGIKLLHQLARLHSDVDFILVGAPEGYSPPTDALSLKNLFVFKRVPHQSIPAVLEFSDLLLMPYGSTVTVDGLGDTSRFCSPLKLFEYLGAGRAIVASRLPSIQEILKHGSNSLLAEPDDVEAWSLCVTELKGDAELRERLGREALRSSGAYTWVERARHLLEGVS